MKIFMTTSGPSSVGSLNEASQINTKNRVTSGEQKWHQIIRDKIGYQLFNIASFCTDAPCKLDAQVTLLKLANTKAKAKDLNESLNRLAYKSYLVFQIFLLSPISLFTGPVGMVFRTLGYFIQPSDFNYKKGNIEEKSYPTDKKATVYFLNTCCIGGGYPLTHGGVLPWGNDVLPGKSRIDLIAEKIIKKDPDLVCLSEIYDCKAGKILYNKLKNNYSHFYLNIGPHHWAAKSGLFVASKYKIQNPHFIDFHDTLVHDKGSCRRGAFGFDSVDKENKPIARVYSAHFEYSKNDSKPSDAEINARKKEVELIIEDIKKNSLSKVPIILTGDLNFSKEEYSKTDLIKYFKKTNQDITGTCRRDEFNKKLWNEKSIDKTKKEEAFDLDHTFILKKSPKDSTDQQNYIADTKIIKSFDEEKNILSALSDHHAMETTINLS